MAERKNGDEDNIEFFYKVCKFQMNNPHIPPLDSIIGPEGQ